MSFDTILLLVAGVTQLAMGALGTWWALRPPKPEYHKQIVGLYVIVGLLGLGAIVWTGIRTSREIEHNQGTLLSGLATVQNGLAKGFSGVHSQLAGINKAAVPPLPSLSLPKQIADPRKKYIIGLQRLYAEGDDVIRHLWRPETDASEETQRQRMWEWFGRVGMWTCKNMGAPAMGKAIPLSLDAYIPSIHFTTGATPLLAKKEASASMISHIQTNLEAMMEHDTWDPIGKPILPEGGCAATVGKATDAPAQ